MRELKFSPLPGFELLALKLEASVLLISYADPTFKLYFLWQILFDRGKVYLDSNMGELKFSPLPGFEQLALKLKASVLLISYADHTFKKQDFKTGH